MTEQGVRVAYINKDELVITAAEVMADGSQNVWSISAKKKGDPNLNCALRGTIIRHLESFLSASPQPINMEDIARGIKAQVMDERSPY